MSEKIRPELSEKNPYWLSRHRFYELKHFCLQYPVWKKAYNGLSGLSKRPDELNTFFKTNQLGDPTARCGMAMAHFSERMEMVERSAQEADPELAAFILKGVTEGLSYDTLKTGSDIPCSRDVYYDRYRKFFSILSKKRQ